ncbi:MAG TPA: lysylphosphatidylglycerol synthase transmembrane domain-containing protein [Dehalococcoidia bacterium]|nr:lysylphosphatidylglycerol synthase transmembrane domain-containing protein [Dehalococcoidia bacterium]
MLKRKRFWFGLIISLAFLAYFLYRIDLGEIVQNLRQADYVLALAAVPLYFVGFWIRAIRWRILLDPVRRVSTRRLYPVVLVGLTANNVMPARVGELVRAYLIGEREKVSKSAALGTIAVDRTFDGLVLVAILAAVTIFSGTSAGVKTVGVGTALVFIGASSVLVTLAFSPNRARALALRVLNLLPHGLEEKVEGLLDNFLTGVQSLRNPAVMVSAAVLTFASWSVETSMYVVVGVAFDLDVGLHVYYLIAAGANLALSILASPGGVGPFEATTKTILLAFMSDAEAAAAYAIGLHALLLGPVTVVGFVLLWQMQFSLSQIMGIGNDNGRPPAGEGHDLSAPKVVAGPRPSAPRAGE